MKKILIFLIPLLVYCSCNGDPHNHSKPNVMFIVVDDMADWVTALKGHPDVLTPNIDCLVSRGIVFSNAHCASLIYGPSRAAILTGMRPENYFPGSECDKSVKLLDLFEPNSISEQHNLAAENPEVPLRILSYLEKHTIHKRYVLITKQN